MKKTKMEEVQGGSYACAHAVIGAVGLFAWSLSVPLTGGISLALALGGATITASTSVAVIECME